MQESHRHPLITAGHRQWFMDGLQQTLDRFTVPAVEQAEIRSLVESTRSVIVAGR